MLLKIGTRLRWAKTSTRGGGHSRTRGGPEDEGIRGREGESDSNNKSKDSSSKSRIGENLKTQEQIQKVYELRPKVDPKPKNK